jgi:hypothetical protein
MPINEEAFKRERDLAAAWAKAEDRVRELELHVGELQKSLDAEKMRSRMLTTAGDWMSTKLDKIAAAARSGDGAALIEALAMEPPTIEKRKCALCESEAVGKIGAEPRCDRHV